MGVDMPEKHKKTDPACVEYRRPRGPYTQLIHDWRRGESCPICMPDEHADGSKR